MGNKIKKKKFVAEEADLKPFMNLMVVLIPMLLLSAEFAKIAIIDIKLPEGRGASTDVTQTKKPDEPEKLLLTAIVTDSVLTLGAKGGFLPSIFYQEYHHYVAKDDQAEFTVRFDPLNPEVKHPRSGRPMEIYERQEIILRACKDDYSEVIMTLYSGTEMLTNTKYEPIQAVNAGDTLFTVSNPRRLIVVKDPSEFTLQPLSVYDELKNRLLKVKERFKDAEDKDDIIIAAEDQVIYDKIVQIMDAARLADFVNISIAKLRG